MIGIVRAGAYVPCRRLQRGAAAKAHAWFAPGLSSLAKGERAFATWDEDALTMAVEAARDALGEGARDSIDRLLFASTTHPFADRQNAGVLKEALDLEDTVGALDICGSQRAGTSALIEALDLARAHRRTLCVASDRRRSRPASEGELINGDAAAAFLVGEGEVAAEFLGSHSVTVDFVDHFRSAGQPYDYGWEPRWVREEGYGKIAAETIREALRRFDIAPEAVDHFLAAAPLRGVDAAMAKQAGIPADRVADSLGAELGFAGTAHPLVMLCHALETARAGAILLVVGFGNGCDVLVFRATGRSGIAGMGVSGWLARRRVEDNYVRFLALTGELDTEKGMRAEFDQRSALTALHRNRRALHGLVGVRHRETGTVQYPPSPVLVDEAVGASGDHEAYPLADRLAHVITFTADSLTYAPDPPCCYGAIEFAGGGRMTAEFADAAPDDLEVGAAMRMMFRIKSRDPLRGFTHYFWKAVPDYRAAAASTECQAAE